jgi:hypothetical protein
MAIFNSKPLNYQRVRRFLFPFRSIMTLKRRCKERTDDDDRKHSCWQTQPPVSFLLSNGNSILHFASNVAINGWAACFPCGPATARGMDGWILFKSKSPYYNFYNCYGGDIMPEWRFPKQNWCNPLQNVPKSCEIHPTKTHIQISWVMSCLYKYSHP